MVTPFELDLLTRAQAGDQRAQGALYTLHWRSIYLYALRLLVDPDLAKDAAQNALLKGLVSLNTLDHPTALRSWLLMIVRNEVFTILRAKRRNGLEPLEHHTDVLVENQTPLEDVMNVERSEIIRRAIENLKPAFREVILLREYEQLSYMEIAAVTQSTESAVKSRLFHARKALLEQLRPLFRERSTS